MNYLLIVAAATIISLIVIPLMIKAAPALGFMDQPDPRKVHAKPIPRVGGWGIFVGALLPMLLAMNMDDLFVYYFSGAAVLFLFGILDDRREMGHYTKFVGQFLAVIPLVVWGDFYVTRIPFFEEALPAWIGMPFTIVAMIGVINALNHSDGLDGLAGGEAIATLIAFALLGYIVNGDLALIATFGTIGGILGFLRFNTHPAMVFMGDGGSQFIGYTLAFLAVLMTQQLDTSLSPSVVVLLLGLPVVDILVVLKKRASGSSNIFVATRNHLHHRLLDIGFVHKESVVLIYTSHVIFVASGVWLRNEPDWIILLWYALLVSSVFLPLIWAENKQWRPRRGERSGVFSKSLDLVEGRKILVLWPRRLLELLLPFYMVAVSVWISDVPRDFGIVAAILCVLLLLQRQRSDVFSHNIRRTIIYVSMVSVIYLCVNDRPNWGRWWATSVEASYYIAVALCVMIAIRFSPGRRKEEFKVTALDYLLFFLLVGSLMFAEGALHIGAFNLNVFIIVMAVMLYATELLLVERKQRADLLGKAAFFSAALIAARGLDLIEFDLHFSRFFDQMFFPQ